MTSTPPTTPSSPTSARRPLRVLGQVLDRAGQLTLPACAGAVLGYYASDQGVRLLPDMLAALSVTSLAAVGLIVLGKVLRGQAWVDAPGGARLRKRIVFVLVLAALAGAARLGVFYTQQESPLTTLPREDLHAAFLLDAQRYRDLEHGMDTTLRQLEAQAWLGPDAPQDVLSTQQEALLLDSFAALWHMTVELDDVRSFYEDWYRFDPSRAERAWHLRSFLLTFAAELTVHESAARFSRLVLPNANAKKFLDAARPDRGLPKTAFSIYRQELLGTRDQARVLAGQQYLQVLARATKGQQEAADLGLSWLWDRCEAHLRVIAQVAPIDRAALLARADAQVFKRSLKRVWFPAQKGVAEAMGDIRARRIGWYLIPEDQQAQAIDLAQPGDILLSRKNWYLSNVGLPGFWPHGILYLGTPEQLTAWADDDGIKAWIHDETGQDLDLPAFLSRRHPAAWARYVAPDVQPDGTTHPHVLIEAVSEGVIFNTMPHAAGDYLAAMRPRLDKKAKAQAIDLALAQLDKPYDFDFDFATDTSLVCTELVWRSYRPGPDKEGLNIPLVTVAGRRTLPANVLAQQFAQQDSGPTRQLDFVFFIDASEHDQKTWFSDEATFDQTWSRTRMDVATQ